MEKLRWRDANRYVSDKLMDSADPRIIAALIMIGGGLTMLASLLDGTLN